MSSASVRRVERLLLDLAQQRIRGGRRAHHGVRLLIDPGSTPVIAGTQLAGSIEFTTEDLAAGIPLELAERVVLLLHLVDCDASDAAEPLGMVGDGA